MSEPLFSAPVSRVLAATLGVLVTSTILTAALPAYLPFSQGDTIAGPILLFPFTWVLLFLYSLITSNIWHVWGGLGLISVVHGVVIFLNVGGQAG